jgi:uncharacterized membrane protein YfcA
MDPIVALVGLVVGLVVGLTSIGAGTILTSSLVLFLGLPPSVVVGSGAVATLGMKFLGGGAHGVRGSVDWTTVGRLASGSIPGAIAGLLFLSSLPRAVADQVIARGLGAGLILAGAAIILRLALKDRAPSPKPPSWPFLATLGAVIGLLVSITSTGAGSVLVAVLALASPLPSIRLVGTDLVHAVLLAVVTSAGHALAGRVDLALAGAILLGAVPGVLLGSRLAFTAPERVLRTGLATALVLVGFYLGAVRPTLAKAAVPAANVTEVSK